MIVFINKSLVRMTTRGVASADRRSTTESRDADAAVARCARRESSRRRGPARAGPRLEIGSMNERESAERAPRRRGSGQDDVLLGAGALRRGRTDELVVGVAHLDAGRDRAFVARAPEPARVASVQSNLKTASAPLVSNDHA